MNCYSIFSLVTQLVSCLATTIHCIWESSVCGNIPRSRIQLDRTVQSEVRFDMADAVCRDISTPQVIVTDDDLGLMNNSSDDCVIKSGERNDHLLVDFPKYHRKKRNSSFSEYFEGDLS